MVEYDQPPELGDEPESGVLPELADATRRVGAYIRAFGDGCVDVIDVPHTVAHAPLYARDLETLVRAAEGKP